ncbi:ABC transporter G family member 10 [Rhodamnia argentea]|uniref:ABC transporter G family member 10 n=1 Tax=Rhodamnia argentea TaxID=178133 RepID=A0A8B8NS12_9MYRT|nr:ABC transporter G family member 10 [Rhodamnia argentea]
MELPLTAPDSGGSTVSYKLETKSLSYKLCAKFDEFSWLFRDKGRNSSAKFILKDVNCEARPAEITAIAGPSGAGKTTLLEVLAGKISWGQVSGEVLVNEQPIDPKSFQRLSGYVPQDDELFPSLTVEETLMYSARLRLHGGRKEAVARVRALMKELGLDHVAGTRIGSKSSNRGISGGEKRRVSIGVELVHDPAVILIDEPTSGLDSASALHVVKKLKFMALHQGKTIILTIHQPGYRILELLDRVVLLSGGFVIHNGPLSLLEEKLRFAGLGMPCHVNVLEYAIDGIEYLGVEAHNNPHFHQGNAKDGNENEAGKEELFSYPNSWFREILILEQRFCRNIFRTKQLFATRVIQALVAGFVLGTIFLNVGDNPGELALQTRLGFFAFSLTFLLSSTTEGLPIYLQERRILMRETSRGAYRVSSYVVANIVVFLPFLLMVCFLYSIPVYWLVGFRRSTDAFFYFSLVVWLVLLMSNSFVACFSALVPNFIMGTSIIAGLMGSFFLFSGYFISKEKIPQYWIFMHYMSLFKYPFECFILNEYGGPEGRNMCLEFENGECSLYGSGFLRQQGLEQSEKWTNIAVMCGFIVGYRVLCLLILWYRCCRTRN